RAETLRSPRRTSAVACAPSCRGIGTPTPDSGHLTQDTSPKTPEPTEDSMPLVSAVIVAAMLALGPASAQTMMHKSLYERLGGIDEIRAGADDLVGNGAAANRKKKSFP